ncbi:MAG TPA: GAF and ANTAR domain-containing protein [Actinomycetes bacterium]|nr:GAF and ANTAR domain-containing protein [Actinomycetes bacterium]
MPTMQAERLAEVFVEVADTLVDDFDLIEFLENVTARAAEMIDASAAGLLLVDPEGRLQFMAASDESAKLLELFGLQAHEGPCQDAFTSGVSVVNADLAQAGRRWPRFAPHAVAAGFRSVHAIPLRHRREVIGALNLFGTGIGRLQPSEVRMVQALADVATIGLLQERAIRRGEVIAEQLQGALNSRIIIEQSKGVLAQTHNVSIDRAFEMLRSYARNHGLRLGDVAQGVIDGSISVTGLTAR